MLNPVVVSKILCNNWMHNFKGKQQKFHKFIQFSNKKSQFDKTMHAYPLLNILC